MVRLGYVIAYVENVNNELTFFEKAFGLRRRFLDPAGDYGELSTGDTVLAFANHDLAESNLPAGYVKAAPDKPLGLEIALVTDNVVNAHRMALAQGAREVCPPEKKPWGQEVSYRTTPSGLLLEICSPVNAD